MIDQTLIDKNSFLAKSAIRKSKLVDPRLHVLKSVFSDDLLDKLTDYFSKNYHSDLWVPESDQYGSLLQDSPRYKLAWDAETVIEELYFICDSLSDEINNLYPNVERKFSGITIWRDHPGYKIGWHTDNPVIATSMQVYIDGGTANPGTEFETINGSHLVPFVINNGYIANHEVNNRPRHRIGHMVPSCEIRYSVFALWLYKS